MFTVRKPPNIIGLNVKYSTLRGIPKHLVTDQHAKFNSWAQDILAYRV